MKKALATLLTLAVLALPLAAVANPVGDQLGNLKARLELARKDITDLQNSGLAKIGAYQYGKVLFHFNFASNLLSQAVALSSGAGFAAPLGKALVETEKARLILEEHYEKGQFTFAAMQGEVRILRNLLGLIKLVQEMGRVGR
jgi:hypothetical protein